MNPKLIEKHSTPKDSIVQQPKHQQTITTKTESTTTMFSSSSKAMYINKTLSKSYDFEKQEHSITESETSTLERKEEDGFFRRLLNRSSKKKKSTDGTDAIAATIEKPVFDSSSLKRLVPVTLETSPKKENVNKTKTMIASSDTIEPSIKKEEQLKQFESVPLALSPSMNTYLSPAELSPPINAIATATATDKQKPILKYDKPRSGPASRQRVLPQELSISPIPPLPSTVDGTEPLVSDIVDNNKLPPKSPKKSPINEGAKPFGYSPKPISKIVFNGLPSELVSNETPNRDSKYSKNTFHRSDEVLVPRFKKFSSDDIASHSSSSAIRSSWMDESKIRSSRVSSILSRIDTKQPDPPQQSPRRKPVEKSKSFRFYTENIATDNLQNSANMPSLPDLSLTIRQPYTPVTASDVIVNPILSRARSKEIVALPQITTPQINKSVNSDNKFEINDNNLIKSKDDENMGHIGLYTKNIILTTTKSPTASVPCGTQNITQIEDNIDKIMKSSLVTVLKKSATNERIEIKSKNNVSVTAITSPTKEEVSSTLDAGVSFSIEKDFSSASSSVSSSPSISAPAVIVRKHDGPQGDGKVPEFMKIQLNRIDSPARPKSHVVLSKNSKEIESKERRFSNENVEITDTSKSSIVGSVSTVLTDFRSNILAKSVDNVSNLSSASVTPVTSPTFKKPFVGGSVSSVSMSDISGAKDVAISQPQKGVVIERRKSVSDEKLKFEKKIEELRAERQRSNITSATDEPKVESRKSSIDDDNVVILRKKSLSQSNTNSGGKEDTPELMKVFARRSLKIKDTDDYQIYGESEKNCLKSPNLDSDKENQSSSEEKLDTLPKLEITIQKQVVQHQDENVTKRGDDGFRKNSLLSPKPFVVPNRFGNVTNYRTTTSFMDTRKPGISSSTTPNSIPTAPIATVTTNTILEQNNNGANVQSNNNNNNNISNNRHTISVVTEKLTKSASMTSETICTTIATEGNAEFKGILQRRAEWEKRAKEAFK